VLSISLLTALSTTFRWFLPLYESYIIILYIFVGIGFIIYGWLLRRWFIKKNLDEKDGSLIHLLKIILPVFSLILIFTLVIGLSSLSEIILLSMISSYLLSIFQIFIISILVGIFAFTFIENNLGILLFKEPVAEQETELGFGLMRKQLKNLMDKQWKYGMIILWLSIMIANMLVFFVYPSIPSSDVAFGLQSLHFSFPNIAFTFNPETGFYQEFFSSVALPSSALLNWKLIQSLISLTFLGLLVMLIYLPHSKLLMNKKKVDENTNNIEKIQESDEKIVAVVTSLTAPEIIEHFDDIDPEILAYKILSPLSTKEYLPSNIINPKPRRKFSKLINRMKNSDVIPVMNLASLNLVVAVYIVSLFQRLGIITIIVNDLYQDSYAQLTHLYWAGLAEEISYRFLIFGVPLFIIYGVVFLFIFILKKTLIKEKKDEDLSRFALWVKSRTPINPLLYLSGRWKKLRILDIMLLLLSSFGFGYAHYQFSPDYWGTWKIFQAGVAGLIFGYAFCKYGLHAAIILHTINDFVIGMIVTPNLGLLLDGGILFMVIIFAGTLVLLSLVAKALTVSFKFINTTLKRTQPITDTSKQK
jgi:hypothetical protein